MQHLVQGWVIGQPPGEQIHTLWSGAAGGGRVVNGHQVLVNTHGWHTHPDLPVEVAQIDEASNVRNRVIYGEVRVQCLEDLLTADTLLETIEHSSSKLFTDGGAILFEVGLIKLVRHRLHLWLRLT
jgi:hypothetical protein